MIELIHQVTVVVSLFLVALVLGKWVEFFVLILSGLFSLLSQCEMQIEPAGASVELVEAFTLRSCCRWRAACFR